jgi:excisionase family DNA binding protein
MDGSNGSESLLTYDEVKERLKCCVRKIRDDYVKTGMLRAVPLGRLVRFRPADVDAFVRKLSGGE